MRKNLLLMSIMSAALVAACHNNPPAEQPAPQPTQAEIARQKFVQDSLDAVARASAEAARLERALADSVERVRVAAREAAEGVARKTAELRAELAVLVHFDPAQSHLEQNDKDALDRKVTILKANPGVRLRITGAADERGSDRYNMALGDRRAAAVRKYLVGQGIESARLDVTSSGENSPLISGSDEAAWAQNRRAEFVIVSGDSPLAMN